MAYWLFGYGSLIWKPPPHYVERVPGYVRGFVRRFWQSSNDHRGTPESPGRVVTLISKEYWLTLDDPHPYGEDDVTWGVAYRIDPTYEKEVRKYMDFREKNGYTEMTVDFYPNGQTPTVKCSVYIGEPSNEAFVGPQNVERTAQLIATSRGPSGENKEYLFCLHDALQQLHPEGDRHIEDLTERVLKLCGHRSMVVER